MSEIGLALGALVLAFLLTRWRRGWAPGRDLIRRERDEPVSLQAMAEMITELTPSLRDTAMVTAPQSYPDRGHVWASPCGKRVYIN